MITASQLILGTGWYAGHIGWYTQIYGKAPELLAQLEVKLAAGNSLTIATDSDWLWRQGPILESDLLMGERYDARLELPGWDTATGGGEGWRTVVVGGDADGGPALEAPAAPQVKVAREFAVREITEPEPGLYVCDLGQNMVGHVRLHVQGQAGQQIQLRFAEVLNDNGTIYTANLRKARATDVYTCRGDTEGETWEPLFTFHGFRYVEITGLDAPPAADTIRGVVMHSEMEHTGSFRCSNDKINQLQHNIEWGQRGNYLEVPTDCPQRDERLGWMGDAQVFASTGCFNFNIAPFMAKWMQDVLDSQHRDGGFTDYAPEPPRPNPWQSTFTERRCSPVWTDAGIIVPWTIYERYGDVRILERSYEGMVRYIDMIDREAADGIGPDSGFGDWLNDFAFTSLDLLSTAFSIHSAELVAQTARVLCHDTDAERFAAMSERFRQAFCRRFVTPDGRIVGDTQTAYALALRFDILPEDLRPAALSRLEYDVMHGRSAHWPYRVRNGHISSGFVGVNQVLPCLVHGSRVALAYRLLLNEDYPSWLFPINHGATTIWERWDGYHPDRGFQDPGMNSFNHYAYGAVGNWLYEEVAGLSLVEPGYRVLRIAPRLDPERRITSAAAGLDTLYGKASVEWALTDRNLTMKLRIPPNTEAQVCVPTSAPDEILEGGEPLPAQAPWLLARDGAELRLGSGEYILTAPGPAGQGSGCG